MLWPSCLLIAGSVVVRDDISLYPSPLPCTPLPLFLFFLCSAKIITREFQPCKPDPAPLFHVCEKWSIDPGSVVMVGDDRVDMACGRAAGAGRWEEREGEMRGGGRERDVGEEGGRGDEGEEGEGMRGGGRGDEGRRERG